MPHIHTGKDEHDHTASALIVRTDGDEPKVILHRHKLLGVYLQFGGHIELNESPWMAVRHELLEESGYDLNDLMILQPKPRLRSDIKQDSWKVNMHPLPLYHLTHEMPGMPHFHTDLGYGFVADKPPDELPQDGESEEIVLFTISEINALSPDEIPESIREASRFIIEVALIEWESVPASYFTA